MEPWAYFELIMQGNITVNTMACSFRFFKYSVILSRELVWTRLHEKRDKRVNLTWSAIQDMPVMKGAKIFLNN
jgi:hypothetical protein